MSDSTFEEAIRAAAEAYPASILPDLLMLFPPEVVAKLLVTFSGEQVRFPDVENVWRAHRDKIIRESLDISNTRVTREALASHFGIAIEAVTQRYRQMKERKKEPLTKGSVKRTARRAYKHRIDGLMGDLREALRRR